MTQVHVKLKKKKKTNQDKRQVGRLEVREVQGLPVSVSPVRVKLKKKRNDYIVEVNSSER